MIWYNFFTNNNNNIDNDNENENDNDDDDNNNNWGKKTQSPPALGPTNLHSPSNISPPHKNVDLSLPPRINPFYLVFLKVKV